MLASVAVACTIVDMPIVVGPDFQVRVNSWRQSSRGLHVELRYSGKRKVAETGSDGLARFQTLAPGFYEVVVQPDAAMRTRALVEVRAKGTSIVRLNWPETEPVRTRTLAGVLRGSRVDRFHVELAAGKEAMETVQANERGEFRFGANVPAGLYFLRVADGVIPVAVDPQAKSERIEVAMLWTSCGLWYTDQSQCSNKEFTVGRITGGQVVDPARSSVGHAKIMISGRAPVETDDAGKFGKLELPEGVYDLEVNGFMSLRRRLRVVSCGAATALQFELPLKGCGDIVPISTPAGK